MHRSQPAGFTLIELLIVVVIVGILASIAIPKFASTKGKAYVASMRQDLRNIATAQEAYFYSNDTYTADLAQLGFTPTSGVQIEFPEASPRGWSARAVHPLASVSACVLFVGGATPLAQGSSEGIITCN